MIQEIKLKPGLTLHTIDTSLENNLTFRFDHYTSLITFDFFFSGMGKSLVKTDTGKKMLFNGKEGDCGISYFPKISGAGEFCAQNRLQIIHIMIEPFLFDELMTGAQEKINSKFYPVLNQKTDHYYDKKTISYAAKMAIVQMLGCPFQGITRKIYLESKALELVALQMDALIFNHDSVRDANPSQRVETDRIYEARKIILDCYRSPPSLGELSRKVGLNEFKLKKGFLRVFGNTVFGCLYDYRMELARQHIEEGKKSVKEIAYSVGYKSTSRFSDAFKRKFGARPTRYHP
jgi:AraC-like DNA-binding protein